MQNKNNHRRLAGANKAPAAPQKSRKEEKEKQCLYAKAMDDGYLLGYGPAHAGCYLYEGKPFYYRYTGKKNTTRGRALVVSIRP